MGAKVHKEPPEDDPLDHHTRVNTILNKMLHPTLALDGLERQSRANAYKNNTVSFKCNQPLIEFVARP